MNRDCLVRALVPVLLVLAVAPALADGPNLLSNPGFDTSTAGWTITGPGALSWASADAHGNPHSGSAKILVTGPLFVVRGTASPCIRLSPGEHYVATGSVWVEHADAADLVGIGFLYFSDPACTTLRDGITSPDLDVTLPGWHEEGTRIGPVPSEVPSEYQAVQIMLLAADLGPRGDFTVYFDDLALRTSTCDPQALCLGDRRFEVYARWKLANGIEGEGRAVPFADDSGSFWFFSPTSVEMTVKVLDGCGLNDHFWFFAAGLTDVEVTIYVRDTMTGELRVYNNPQGRTFRTITDTTAFTTCP